MPDSPSLNWFDKLTEFLGWVAIVLSPTLAGALLGGIWYVYSLDFWGMAGWIAISLLGLTIGVLWANHLKKKYGTIWFLSRIMATPELDRTTPEKEETSSQSTKKS